MMAKSIIIYFLFSFSILSAAAQKNPVIAIRANESFGYSFHENNRIEGFIEVENQTDSMIKLIDLKCNQGSTIAYLINSNSETQTSISPHKSALIKYLSNISIKYSKDSIESFFASENTVKLPPIYFSFDIKSNDGTINHFEPNLILKNREVRRQNSSQALFLVLPEIEKVKVFGPDYFGFRITRSKIDPLSRQLMGSVKILNRSESTIEFCDVIAVAESDSIWSEHGSGFIPPNGELLLSYSSSVIKKLFGNNREDFLLTGYVLKAELIFCSADKKLTIPISLRLNKKDLID